MTDDMALVREFAQRNSEEAFATVVSRHINLVYSIALRQVRDPHLAEEITQVVFIILAKKAASLSPDTILSGWLCRTARYSSARALLMQQRRERREQEAYMQSLLNESEQDNWNQIAPLLDAAMSKLAAKDHDAIVLRFFENKDFRAVAGALGTSEDAAKKRVGRAVDKLRKFFTKRGAALSTVAIVAAVSANSVQAAPAGLATSTTIAAVKGAAATSSTLTLTHASLKLIAWTKAKTAAVVGLTVVLAAVATSVVVSTANRPTREAGEIMDRTFQKYASLSSYDGTGKTIQVADRTLTASFSLRLGRPNFYHFEYEQSDTTFTNKGAAWSAGAGDFFANDIVGKTTKWPFPGPSQVLGDLVDVSGGAPAVVPAIFFGIPIPDQPRRADTEWRALLAYFFDKRKPTPVKVWSTLIQPADWPKMHFVKRPEEKLGDADCYVLSASTDHGAITLWIGKQDFLIRQSEERVKSTLPDATDAEVSSLLANIPGKPPLPMDEMKRRINVGRKQAAAAMKQVTVVFSTAQAPGLKSMTIDPPTFTTYTQTQENITVNRDFSPLDFAR